MLEVTIKCNILWRGLLFQHQRLSLLVHVQNLLQSLSSFPNQLNPKHENNENYGYNIKKNQRIVSAKHILEYFLPTLVYYCTELTFLAFRVQVANH